MSKDHELVKVRFRFDFKSGSLRMGFWMQGRVAPSMFLALIGDDYLEGELRNGQRVTYRRRKVKQ